MPALQIDYKSWKKNDLACLTRARSLANSVINTSKHQSDGPHRHDYIRALQKADEATKNHELPYFDFMELPPELRTRVYEELLVIKEGEHSCWPDILRVSRGVHQEARNVLYGEVEMGILLDDRGVFVGGHCIHEYRYGNGGFWQIEWPDHLQRCQWIKVSVNMQRMLTSPDITDDYGSLVFRSMVYSLSCFLQDANALRSLEFELIGNAAAYRDQDVLVIIDVLWLIGTIKRLTFSRPHAAPVIYKHYAWSPKRVRGKALGRAVPIFRETEAYATIEAIASELSKEKKGVVVTSNQKEGSKLGYAHLEGAHTASMSHLLWDVPQNLRAQVARLLSDEVWREWGWEEELLLHTLMLEHLLDALDVEAIDAWAANSGTYMYVQAEIATMKSLRAARKGQDV